MALTLTGNSISGLSLVSPLSISRADFYEKGLKYDLSKKATLYTGITDSGTTTVRTATLSNYFVMTANTKAVVIRFRYIHNGSTNHGYFNAKLYQSGYQSNSISYESYHYDWYYNTTNETFLVPWYNTSNWDLKIECTSSYNSSGSNTYSIYLEGVVLG